MPLDAICINGLKTELAAQLTGAKIDKVQQPAKDMVLLTLRGEGRNEKLLISCGTGSARVHITKSSFENPQSPPMFCMLLRKHLTGARIANVSQPDYERMLVLDINAFDELGDAVTKRLVVELMGRSSNIILVGHEGHIIDCLRRVDGTGQGRGLLPGLIYRLPPKQDKPCFFILEPEEISNRWNTAAGEKSVDEWLIGSFSGLSPLVCRELCYRSTGEMSPPFSTLSEAKRAAVLEELFALRERVAGGRFEPTVIMENGNPKDFTFMPVNQYENAATMAAFADFSTLLDSFYTARDKKEQLRRKAQSLLRPVKSARERELRKLTLRRQELQRASERELSLKRGDLVTANLYRLKKGDRFLVCEDYYEENMPEIKIHLDPLKTPQQNAETFYKQYTKAKTAESHLTALIEKGEKEATYLESVADELERAENEDDLEEIRRELTETGWIKAPKNAKKGAKKEKKNAPARFVSSNGMEILVGKSNTQNDELTTKIARRNDMWLHVQKLHGSHVVISCNDKAPDDATIKEAASLAVYFSQARDGGKAPVDYTLVRNVKKPAGAMPGAVIYTGQKTIIAEPEETIIRKLAGN